jgi:hypothetical protein
MRTALNLTTVARLINAVIYCLIMIMSGSIESDYNIKDHINPGNAFINRKDNEWHVLFNKDKQIVREEKHLLYN